MYLLVARGGSYVICRKTVEIAIYAKTNQENVSHLERNEEDLLLPYPPMDLEDESSKRVECASKGEKRYANRRIQEEGEEKKKGRNGRLR